MELHQPFQHKRARSQAGFDGPVSSLSSHIPFVDPSYTSLPFDPQLPPGQITVSYGITSDFQVPHDISLEHLQKRRRIESHIPMSYGYIPCSAHGFEEKVNVTDPHDHHHGQPTGMSRWISPFMSDSASLGSPLARRMVDWSLLLCPCCGFGWEQLDGYQPLPEAPATVYDPGKPYSMEQVPSMQVPALSQRVPSSLDTQQHLPFYKDEPNSASSLTGYTTQDQTSLPLAPPIADDGSYQPGQLLPEFFPESTVKRDPHITIESTCPSDPLASGHPSPIHYSPTLLDIPSSIPATNALTNSLTGVPEVVAKYDLLPADEIPADVMPDALPSDDWAGSAAHDEQSHLNSLPPIARGGKRGPFRDISLRKQTAQTRKIGSCIRCRMQRIRCEYNPDEPGGGCMTCKKVCNSKAGRFPCLRYKITDIRLYKPGQVPGYEWTRRWSNNISDPIRKWASSDMKTIHISDGYSAKCIELRVREFVPQDGDKLERSWYHNGTQKSVQIPPFALVDMEDAKKAYTKHIRDSMSDIFRTVLGRSDGLLYKTYLQAWQICRDPSTPIEALELLNWTLRLWVSIRLSTTSGFIVGNETLGMNGDILDDTSPNPGKIPMPPVLGAQMDLVLIHHIQTKLRRELLDRLQKMVLKNKQSSWLVTYLVTFILLHNTALITAHDASYARKHGMKRRFAREDKVQEYQLGANILLAHFHYCNKGVHPFSDQCKDQDLRMLADLDDGKIQFVHATRSYAKRRKREWEQLREQNSYEDDYFFVSQLFEEGWQPRSASF